MRIFLPSNSIGRADLSAPNEAPERTIGNIDPVWGFFDPRASSGLSLIDWLITAYRWGR